MNNLSRNAGEVAARRAAGEGPTARVFHAAGPSPSPLTRLDLSRFAGEVLWGTAP